MGLDEVKKTTLYFFMKLGKKALIRIIGELKNLIEDLHGKNIELEEQVKKLGDEINQLKGEKGRPDIKPSIKAADGDNIKDKPDNSSEKKNWTKSLKKPWIKITRREKLKLDRNGLPQDATYKGTRKIVIQDIKIESDNIEFEIERYYSEKEKKSFEAKLPDEYHGSEFGPGIRSFILLSHYQGRMPHKLLHNILTGMGVIISEGEVCRIINNNSEAFLIEKEKARQIAIAKQGYQQIDDTGARIEGKNGFTIATCNKYFTSYETRFTKNRLSALEALIGDKELLFLIDNFAIKYLKEKLPGKAISKHLDKLKSERLYNEEEFSREILRNPEISKYGEYTTRYVKEACAIGAYRSNYLGEYANKLVCDDAQQFKSLTEHLQLCWVHEARHYKKLEPYMDEFKEILNNFMDKFWNYYYKLKDYKSIPTSGQKENLFNDFDKIFTPNTGYFALDRIIKETKKKKESLLLVLEYPEIPLHNNECELDIREKVVQRKIRNCYRSIMGAKTSDIFLSLMAICRKNKVSFWAYLKDRIYKTFNIPPLDKIIEQAFAMST